MMLTIRKFTRKQDGATILEYIVLGAVLVLGLVYGVSQFRDSATDALQTEGKAIKDVAAKGENSAAKSTYK